MLSKYDKKILDKYNKVELTDDEKLLIKECIKYPPDLQLIEELLGKGVDPNLFFAIPYRNKEEILSICDADTSNSHCYYLLSYLISCYGCDERIDEEWDQNCLTLVKVLLNYGVEVDVDFDYGYPLRKMEYAYKLDRSVAMEIVKLLLDHGADPLKNDWEDLMTLFEYARMDEDPVDWEYDGEYFSVLNDTYAQIVDDVPDLRYGTKLLELYSDGVLGIEQIAVAAHICACEYEKYDDKLQQFEAAEEKSLEIIRDIRNCQTEEEIKVVLGLDDEEDFVVEDGKLISYSGLKQVVVIPDTVREIGHHAFACNKQIRSVYIPDSVTEIGRMAFLKCTNLNKVVIGSNVRLLQDHVFLGCTELLRIEIPGSVKTIGLAAFKNCTSLWKVYIGNGVQKISVASFSKCYSLSEIMIPESVKRIGRFAFSKCRGLKRVDLRAGAIKMPENVFHKCPEDIAFEWRYKESFPKEAENGFDIDGEGTLVNYFGTKEEVVVPSCVRRIGGYAFADRGDIISVELPNSVVEIGDCAFSHTYNMESIVMPSVEIIDRYAFCGSGIRKARLPKSLKVMGEAVFIHCNRLESIVFESRRVDFKGRIAAMCDKLEEVILPKEQDYIPISAFYYSSSLKKVTIPKTVDYIGSGAFEGCNKFDKSGLKLLLHKLKKRSNGSWSNIIKR